MQTEDSMTTPVESGNPDTTPESSGNALTTPPEAEQTGTTQESAEHDIEKIVKKRLDRERKKWEAEREEAAKRARMDEAERLKAELADRDKAIEAAKAEARRERTLRQLGPDKVVDAEEALYIAERLDLVGEDGSVDLEALLKAKPFLAPPEAKRVDLPGQKTMPGPKGDLTPDDFRGKDQTWIAANLHRLKSPQ